MIYHLFDSKIKRTLVLLKLIVITLPFSLLVNNILIGLLIINTVFGLNRKRVKESFTKHYLLLLLAAPFALNVMGLFYSHDYSEGWLQVEKSATLLLFPLVFIFTPPFTKKQLIEIGHVFIYLCLFIIIYSLGASFLTIVENKSLVDVSKLTDRKYYYFTYEYLAGTIGMSPIYLSIYFNLAIVFVIQHVLQEKINRTKAFTLVVLFGTYVILLSSKMGIIILIFIITISLWSLLINKVIKKRAAIFLSTFVVALLVIILSFKPIRDRMINIDYTSYDISQGHIGYWNGASMRLAIWSCAREVFEKNIWIGVGTGNVREELNKKYFEKNFKLGILLSYNAHSQYFQYALRVGIIGSVLFIASNLIYPFFLAVRTKSYVFLLFIVIYGLSFLTESILERQQGVVLYGLFFSVLLSTIVSKQK